MTGSIPMSLEEQMAELFGRQEVLEKLVSERDLIIASAVLKQVTETEILTELIQRVAAAVEAEWTGKFLPELRRTIRADVRTELHGEE